jgi:hypothetical protein
VEVDQPADELVEAGLFGVGSGPSAGEETRGYLILKERSD